MVAFTRYMSQEATYWEPGIPDGFGGTDFSAVTPVVVAVRWQEQAELFRDQNAREVTSNAVVYCAQQVAERGYIALGDVRETGQTDPRQIEGTYEIRKVNHSPNIAGNLTLYKAMV